MDTGDGGRSNIMGVESYCTTCERASSPPPRPTEKEQRIEREVGSARTDDHLKTDRKQE